MKFLIDGKSVTVTEAQSQKMKEIMDAHPNHDFDWRQNEGSSLIFSNISPRLRIVLRPNGSCAIRRNAFVIPYTYERPRARR